MTMILKDVTFPHYVNVDRSGGKMRLTSAEYLMTFEPDQQLILVVNKKTMERAYLTMAGVVMRPEEEPDANRPDPGTSGKRPRA